MTPSRTDWDGVYRCEYEADACRYWVLRAFELALKYPEHEAEMIREALKWWERMKWWRARAEMRRSACSGVC
jgi:hypothetical protein